VQLGVYLRACLGVSLRESGELTWERIGMQAGSVPSSAIENVLQSLPGSVLQSGLRAYFGAYSQAGWECHRVKLGASLRACPGVCLRAS
jgi:hypothetical protein